METIKVNMSPNPLDVQTIHASQNDGEAREWGFALHNNGEKIDSSSISDQLVFKSYKGGTEQILPENGAVPVTAPFVGDIKYPDATRTDQEFLYRQSPTEEDGLAKIKSLYGNTLVWNQLANAGTLSAAANYNGYLNIGTLSFVTDHKYLIKYHQDNAMASNSRNTLQVRFNTVGISITQNANPNANLSEGDYYWLYTSANTDADTRVRIWIADNDVAVSYSNIMIFDLTQMGLDSITSVDEFTALFPKSYYDYCQGAMLSFGGRNVKFNQLVQNGNFADSSNWAAEGSATINSVTNNTINVTTANSGNSGIAQISFPMTNGHQYLLVATIKTTGQTNISVSGIGSILFNTNSFVTKSDVFTWTAATGNQWSVRIRNFDANSATFEARNVMLIDLTEMFGAGNEPSAEGFKELFPNDYYEYTTGTYMNIGQPVSLKTTGKNLFTGAESYSRTEAGYYIREGTGNSPLPLKLAKGTYTISIKSTVGGTSQLELFSGGMTSADRIISPYVSLVVGVKTYTFTIDKQCDYIRLYGNFVGTISNIQIEAGSTATDYEPYVEHTLSIPLDEFPNGMDGVGDAYDELSNSGYAKRMGRIDLGSITYTRMESQISGIYYFVGAYNSIPNIKNRPNSVVWNIKTPLYETVPSSNIYLGRAQNKTIGGYDGRTVRIRDDSFTDATEFKNSLSGQYLVYELATPTETSFTTASLVTENAEISLSSDDGVLVGKCTEELSENPGFIDAKIKLADADGECYSNKLQLHVERSPQ